MAEFSEASAAATALVGQSPLTQPTAALALLAAVLVGACGGWTAARYRRRGRAHALKQSERRFELLVQSVTDYAIFMLDPDGRVTNWNAGAERIKLYSADEIVGSHLSRFYTEEDQAAGLPSQALATAAQEGRFESEGWRVRKDGTRFWASVVIDRIEGEHGNLIGFAKVTRDINERRQAQQALEQAQQALLQTQKMEALGQLTGGVAHDFNNLLMAVLGSLELLRKRIPQEPKLLRLVDNAVQAAQRGAALTQRMLAFARRQELKPEAVDIPELVRGMTTLLQSSIGPAVRIETRFPLGLPRVLVDSNQLELALLNLAVNARDAMQDGGTIMIEGREARGQLESLGLAAGHYVSLTVTDTGAGMDELTLARAQEPFFTTKGVGKGTGLGLSMVHGLAEQSKGRLVIRSQLGTGTSAEIWLPVADAGAAQQAGTGKRPAESRPVPSLIVLVVDDDPIVLENAAAMLEDLGHNVIEARSGKEAIELVRRTRTLDLLVTDQAMPEMTGTQLIESVRRERPEVKIILATGYAELPFGETLHFPRLAKPFDQAALAEAVALAVHGPAPTTTVVPFRRA